MVFAMSKKVTMEKKIIFIKLKAQACKAIQYFEDSYKDFTSNGNKSYYYNFPMDKETTYLSELSAEKEYYFFALVYEDDEEKRKERFVKAFLGNGKFIEQIEEKHRFFSDKNELMNSSVVSALLSFFINDVIAISKNKMDNYPVEKFEENGHKVDEDKIIWFSDDAKAINDYLETLISNRVINSPEVSLFDDNGATIVASLFKAYYNNPRLIHKGTQRRIYVETRRFTQNVVDFEFGNHKVILDEIQKITKADLSDENKELSAEIKQEYMQKRRILVRNICDYISGMTDTYATNEYRRIEKQL